MAEPTTAKPRKTATSKNAASDAGGTTPESKQRFAKALEEARAGAEALTKEAQDRAASYRAKATSQSNEWIDEAKVLGEQAKEKAYTLAGEGKTKASEAIHNLGQVVEDNAAMIDEKVGAKYGDYARSAAKGMKDAAEKIDNKDLGELGEDAKQFVRKSPGMAVAMAAAAGFLISRVFRRSGN